MSGVQKTVLNVGCGPRRGAKLHWSFVGWKEVRLDMDPRCEPDVVSSMVRMPGVESGTMDAVFSSHSLEHVAPHEVPLTLAEFFRVLKPDGDVLVHMPDLTQACAAVADGRPEQPLYQSPGGPVAALDMIFGHRASLAKGLECMAHKTGFTEKLLRAAFEKAGFVGINAWVDQFDLWGTAHKPKQDER